MGQTPSIDILVRQKKGVFMKTKNNTAVTIDNHEELKDQMAAQLETAHECMRRLQKEAKDAAKEIYKSAVEEVEQTSLGFNLDTCQFFDKVWDAICKAPNDDKNDENEDRVPDLLQKLDESYVPGRQFTVGDLLKVSREYARQILSSHENAHVTDDGKIFTWRDEQTYSPDIIFEATEDNVLDYDRTGMFCGVNNYNVAETIYKTIEFDPRGNIVDSVAIWGVHTTRADGTHFRHTPACDANAVLLAVQWGGAHSTTRGLTQEEASRIENVLFFEKSSSKKGGYGYDFYIISLQDDEKLRDAVVLDEIYLKQLMANWEMQFAAKYAVICSIEDDRKKYQEACAGVEKELYDLACRVSENSLIADCAYVHGLEVTGCPELGEQEYSYDMSLDELIELVISKENFDMLSTICEKQEIKVRAWEKFAPLYAQLHDVVAQECYGWLEVYGDKAELQLPDTSDDNVAHIVIYEFNFTEKKLQNCIRLIEDYIKSERGLAVINSEFFLKISAGATNIE